MTLTKQHDATVQRRAELLAELWLQDLQPAFVTQPSGPDVGYDYLVGFENSDRGVNLVAVEVKATERKVSESFSLDRRAFDRLAHSNIPVLLLVVDVKQNRLLYSMLGPNGKSRSDTQKTVVSLTELNDDTKRELRNRLAAGVAT